MTHKHQFVFSSKAEKPRPKGISIYSVIEGAIYVCIDPKCAEVRVVWSDGEVIVPKEGLSEKDEI